MKGRPASGGVTGPRRVTGAANAPPGIDAVPEVSAGVTPGQM